LEILPPGVRDIRQTRWSRALFEAHRVRADAPSAADALERLNAAVSDLRHQAAWLEAREAQVDAQVCELDEKRWELREMGSALLRRLRALSSRARVPKITQGAAINPCHTARH